MSLTPECEVLDVTDPAHDRCTGVVPDPEWWSDGSPCDCSCHTMPRCLDIYMSDHNPEQMFACGLHLEHGGNFHRSLDRPSVLWSVRP